MCEYCIRCLAATAAVAVYNTYFYLKTRPSISYFSFGNIFAQTKREKHKKKNKKSFVSSLVLFFLFSFLSFLSSVNNSIIIIFAIQNEKKKKRVFDKKSIYEE